MRISAVLELEESSSTGSTFPIGRSNRPHSQGEKAYAKMYFPTSLDLGKASMVTVKEGEEIPAIDILMKKVVAYRIRGKVTNPLSKTRGAQNAQIAVLRRDSGAEWSEVGSTSVEKADGTFEIPGLLDSHRHP